MSNLTKDNYKQEYRHLLKHVEQAKNDIATRIEDYEIGSYATILDLMGKKEERLSIIEIYKLLEEELIKLNL